MKILKNIEIVCKSIDCEECKMVAVAVVRENGLKLGRFWNRTTTKARELDLNSKVHTLRGW